MSRTNNLRELMYSMLKVVCDRVYYEVADKDALYPHVVFTVDTIDNNDIYRKDYSVDIDIWDNSAKAFLVEELADKIEDMFNNANKPQDKILPTFYLIDRKMVTDENKKIRHRLIRVLVQNYEKE